MIFVTNNNATKVLEPRKEAFHFPAFFVSSQRPTILSCWFHAIVFMWSNQFNAPFLIQAFIQRVAVICHITGYFFRNILKKAGIKSIINKLYFMRAGTACADGDRKTESVRNAHNLGSFALFGFAHTIAPFFAGAKVPSIKPSLMSIPPRFFKSWANAVSILTKTPDLFHCWKYRWQVLFGGYRSGKSFHWAPVLKIQSMPLRTSLGFCGGLPDFPGWA